MKVIRWLLSHIFLILLIIVVIYGYMFWGNLLGKETPAGKAVAYLSEEFVAVKDFVDAVKEKQARLNNEQPPGIDQQQVAMQPVVIDRTIVDKARVTDTRVADNAEVVDNAGRDDITQQKEVIVIESTPNEVIVTEKVTTHIEHKQAEQMATDSHSGQAQDRDNDAVVANTGHKFDVSHMSEHKNTSNLTSRDVDNKASDGLIPDRAEAKEMAEINGSVPEAIDKSPAVEAALNSEASAADENSEHASFVPVEIEKQLENVDKQGLVIDPSQNTDAVREDWITARKSFYQRNYTLSEQSYKKVIDRSEDNFDAYGELGNVYFNQGKNKEAASAYFEAATILIRKGEVSRARSLMGVLRHLDRSKADGLQQLIDSEKS